MSRRQKEDSALILIACCVAGGMLVLGVWVEEVAFPWLAKWLGF